ncbi:hypothetical protein CRE_07618 [Caenorhabditis remanei]|uniref:F-box domain-containing protein n=1 Tax=Caenorhabditis remanei TaxID=31234 RepID=E3MP95_CAERE|nr:hypothetical protein CRE_07618 [Caenorhabditis remanei]
MEPTFPLLRLPENALIEVLKNMRLKELLEFSYVSTKTQNVVTSLRIKADDVNITIYDSNEIALHMYRSNLGFRPSTLNDFRNNLNYIRTIFSRTSPPNVRFYADCERHEIELLKEIIGNVNILYVASTVTDALSREILKHFNTPNRLYLGSNPFEDTCQVQQIFIQNHNIIEFDGDYSLDDMLLINSEKVRFIRFSTQKTINQFLKHWIRGSNPRMQRMDIPLNKDDFANGETYLKGIRYIELSDETKIEIRQEHSLSVDADMIQIRREDGTPAVIATNERDQQRNIHLIVLH